MKTRIKKLNFVSLGLGFLVFTFAFFISIDSMLFTERLLRSDGEITAVQKISTIRTLQAQYASRRQGNFAPDFNELIKFVNLDEKFAGENPVVNGYVFTMKVEPPSDRRSAFYSINANPIKSKDFFVTDNRHFYFDSTITTIKITEENRPANAADPSL